MKPDALRCMVGTSMFTKVPALRQWAPETAASRLRALAAPADGGAKNESLERYFASDDLLDREVLNLVCSVSGDGERRLEFCGPARGGVQAYRSHALPIAARDFPR